jgi:hypothetical protein
VPSLPALDPKDYPNVTNWLRSDAKTKKKRNYATLHNDSDADDDENDDESDDSKNPDTASFIVTEEGKVIDKSTKEAIWAAARQVWNDLFTGKKPPKSFRKAGVRAIAIYRYLMESRFLVLRLCGNSWKADKVWKLNFGSWRDSHVKSLAEDSGDEGGNGWNLKRKDKERGKENIREPSAKRSRVESNAITDLKTVKKKVVSRYPLLFLTI